MCWYLPKWGLMWASLVRQLMIWMTSFRPLPLVNGMSTASMTAVMTAWIVFGDSYHTASPNEEQGLGWHVRWVSDVLSFIALFWIWTIKICTFSVLQISDLWCFCWRSSRRTLFATAQYNTCNKLIIMEHVAMYSTASAKHLLQTLFIRFDVLDNVKRE